MVKYKGISHNLHVITELLQSLWWGNISISDVWRSSNWINGYGAERILSLFAVRNGRWRRLLRRSAVPTDVPLLYGRNGGGHGLRDPALRRAHRRRFDRRGSSRFVQNCIDTLFQDSDIDRAEITTKREIFIKFGLAIKLGSATGNFDSVSPC